MKLFLDGSFKLNVYERIIIESLYRFRLLSLEQILFLNNQEIIPETFPVNPKNDSEWRKKYTSKYSRIRRELLNLVEHRFVSTQPYKLATGRQAIMMFTLHEERLEAIKELLEIPMSHIGSGWDHDYGDMPQDFYRFPKRIEHQVDSINFYIKLLYLSPRFNFRNEIDYTDNIYAARVYPNATEIDVKLRPDGELKIFGYKNDELMDGPGFHAWVEVDRSTENVAILKSKFENYNSFLHYALEKQLPHPNTILVSTNAQTGISRRWSSFLNAYLSQINFTHLNMILCNSLTIKSAIESHANRSLLHNELKQHIESIGKRDLGFKGQLHVGIGKQDISVQQQQLFSILEWLPQFTITENEPTKPLLYLYLKYDGHESQGISRLIQFIRIQADLPAPINKLDIVPVFFQRNGLPLAIPTIETLDEYEQSIFNRSLTFIAATKEWYDEKNNLISKKTSVNPLVYGLYQ